MFTMGTVLLAAALNLRRQALVDFSNAPWEAWPEIIPPDRLVYYGDCVTPIDNPTWSAALFELRGTEYVQLGNRVNFFGPGLEGIWASDGILRIVSVPVNTPNDVKRKHFWFSVISRGSRADLLVPMRGS